MKIIHTRVNQLLEEKTPAELAELGESIPSGKMQAAMIALEGNQTTGYTYFNKQSLENLDIIGIDREIIINFSTRDIVDINGVENKGYILYRSLSWENIMYQDRNTTPPTFSLSKRNFGLNATIIVNNISYGGNVSKGTVSYRLSGQSEWKQVTGTEVPVTVSRNI
ncbi:MAG: hypothetical protein IKP28_00890 [Clostridia bacterium]|nr:hypothetical protein [Clostridia bacterium]